MTFDGISTHLIALATAAAAAAAAAAAGASAAGASKSGKCVIDPLNVHQMLTLRSAECPLKAVRTNKD